MQKKVLSSLLLLILVNLLVKPMAIFGIDATVQDRVGSEAYGLYFSLLNLSVIFNILMDLGINNYTTKNVAQYPHIVPNYMGKVFSLRLVLFVIYTIVTLALATSIGYRDEQLMMLLVLIFNQFLITLIAYLRSHFGGLHLFRIDALISVLDKVLLILICGYLLFFTVAPFTIEQFIWIQTVCYLLTLITAFIFIFRQIGIPRFHFRWVFSMALIRKSFPYALLILLMMMYTRTDSIMLERLHPNGSYESGVYARGFRLLDAFFMFSMLFSNILLPVFSRMMKTAPSEVPHLLKSSRDLLVGGAVLIAFICWFHAESILEMIYNGPVSETVDSMQFLMFSFVGLCLSLIYGTLITARGDMKFLNVISAIGVFLNIALNALAIPEYGAEGAALATVITQGFTALAQVIYVHTSMRISFSLTETARYTALILTVLLAENLVPKTLSGVLIMLILGTVALFVLRLIDLKGILQVITLRK